MSEVGIERLQAVYGAIETEKFKKFESAAIERVIPHVLFCALNDVLMTDCCSVGHSILFITPKL